MKTHDPMTGVHHHDLHLTADMIRADAQRHFDSLDLHPLETSARQFRRDKDTKIPMLVDPLLQRTGAACLAGSSDTGKSALLRQLAAAVAAGDAEFLGFPLQAVHRSAIYVSTEDGRDATRSLIKKQTLRYDENEIESLRFIFDYEDILTTLREALEIRRADLIVIDCFADVFGGDLKDTQKLRAAIAPFQKLAEDYECLVLFLHHTGKRTESLAPSKNNMLSGQGFEAKMRLVVELRKGPTGNEQERHWCIVKGNYLPAEYKNESFVLRFDPISLTFTNTGERTPFELLVRGEDVDASKAKYEEAKELRDKGMSFIKIAEALGYGSKTSVIKLFDKAKAQGWDKTTTDEATE